MAITPFGLAKALVESAGAYSPVEAYDFGTDNLNECTADMNFRIMSEAVDMHEIIVSTDELLAEAAISGNPRIDVLHENVFKTIKEGVLKFLNKIKAMVKSIIEKIKAHFYKLTGKTSKWVNVMRPKVDAVKRDQPGYSDFSAECYNWKRDFLAKGGAFTAGVDSIMAAWDKDVVQAVGGGADAKEIENLKRQLSGNAQIHSGSDAENEKMKADTKDVDDRTKQHKGNLETFEKNYVNNIAGFFKVSATSIDGVWAEITKMAHGGETEKVTRKVGNDVDGMMTAVEKSGEAIDEIKKFYEAHLKKLDEFTKKVQNIGGNLDIEGEDKIPGEYVRAMRECYKAQFDNVMKMTSAYETAANSARQLHTNLVQSMTSDYMAILMKFANFKAAKK